MYSPLIVDQSLHALTKKGLAFERRTLDERLTRTKALSKRVDSNGNINLSGPEKEFVRSEILLCRHDFNYFCSAYGMIEKDAVEGGGVGISPFWPSQVRALELISQRQEQSHAEFQKYGKALGICLNWHKSRQQAATATLRLISGHRMIFYKHTRAIAASLDSDKVHELYRRDKVLFDNLPFFLKLSMDSRDGGNDVKDSQIRLAKVASEVTYQQANQVAGVGTGAQFDVSHMTEVGLWPDAWRLLFDFLPAVPKSPSTFVGWESTANGRGELNFWYQFTESVRKKEPGFEHWVYIFTPCYVNSNKNWAIPPDPWEPNETTKEYAELVEKTSAEFSGSAFHPGKEHLYWWESEYKQNKKLGTLAVFFTNYPATPEQSFQYNSMSALPIETLEWMRSSATLPGMPYSYSLTAPSR